LKLKLMRAKRIVAVIVLLVIAFLIVFPPFATGGVRVTLSSTTSVAADHLYLTIGEVSGHRVDISGASGWQVISNKSLLVDLTTANMSETIALGNLPLGQYETLRVKITNATMIVNGVQQRVQLDSSVFPIPVSFLTRLGTDAVTTLEVAPEVQTSTDGANLKLSFIAATGGTSS